jgi:hypothetical protein
MTLRPSGGAPLWSSMLQTSLQRNLLWVYDFCVAMLGKEEDDKINYRSTIKTMPILTCNYTERVRSVYSLSTRRNPCPFLVSLLFIFCSS